MTPGTLRPATEADGRLLWEWANDAAVRANAFHSDPIPWETHQAWLAARLASVHSRIWIMERDGEPVGQIRYDRQGDVAEIGISVAAAYRGQGIGQALLGASCPRACAELQVRRLVALVKPHNRASAHAFEHAGFRQLAPTSRHGQPCLVFELRCAGLKSIADAASSLSEHAPGQ
jgi:UDP-2,4-diacetamido-2,4,6-trideoxy-beta-L-altropyranose hydrolase